MRPENFKSPFKRGERREVMIEDRVWHIPPLGLETSSFAFPGWEDKQLFGNANPVHVEYCSGNGAWIASKAAENAKINWIAVEKKYERVKKIWSKIKNFNLNNLIVISGEALLSTKYYFPSGSISAAYVNFPDPWPKSRHAKHRLIQPAFIQEVARILHHSGDLSLVTDAIDYSSQMIEVLVGSELFDSSLPSPYYTEEVEDYGSSYFDQLWREQGRKIRYHHFQKRLVV